MKIKLSKLIQRTVNAAIMPVNMVITAVNTVLKFTPALWVLTKFVASRPRWVYAKSKAIHQIGSYRFTDYKGRHCVILLVDEVAARAIGDPDAHSSRQQVLDQLREIIAVSERHPDFCVPSAIYLWNHPAFGFKTVERLGDAWRNERREYLRPIREGVGAFVSALTD